MHGIACIHRNKGWLKWSKAKVEYMKISSNNDRHVHTKVFYKIHLSHNQQCNDANTSHHNHRLLLARMIPTHDDCCSTTVHLYSYSLQFQLYTYSIVVRHDDIKMIKFTFEPKKTVIWRLIHWEERIKLNLHIEQGRQQRPNWRLLLTLPLGFVYYNLLIQMNEIWVSLFIGILLYIQ